MTELERREKARKKVRAKHPDVTDPGQLDELTDKYLKRQRLLLIAGGFLFYTAAYIIYRKNDVNHIGLYLTLAVDGMFLFLALSSGRKERRRPVKNEPYLSAALSRARLSEEQETKKVSLAFPLVVTVGAAVVLFISKQNGNPRSPRELFLIYMGCCAVGWLLWFLFALGGNKKNRRIAESLRTGKLRVVRNFLTDKEIETRTDSDGTVVSDTNWLYFHRTDAEGRRKIEVSYAEYRCAEIGELYYLIYLEDKLYRAIPVAGNTLDAELTRLTEDDPAVVGVREYSEYEEYQKLVDRVGGLAKKRWLKTHSSLPTPDRRGGS